MHRDVGGDIRRDAAVRPFSNISLTWMLRRAANLGLVLPEAWEARFPEDCAAPSVGPMRGAAKFYLLREPRVTGQGDGEMIRLSIRERMAALADYQPRGRVDGQ